MGAYINNVQSVEPLSLPLHFIGKKVMAQHFGNSTIHGGNFWNVNGDYHVMPGSSGASRYFLSVFRQLKGCIPGMQNLNLFISHGALQDSAARYPPPRCFPGKRKKEKEIIRRWIEDPNPCSSVFLIKGRAGVEKTALMQTIADQLQAENRHPYACFFFNRGVVGCDNMDQLFSTLAYQLAINIPSMRKHIEQAMVEDPALPRRSATTQLQKLIIIPFKLLPTPRPSLILIIDGLDECEGEDSQDAFLELISQVLEDPAVTIQFIVSGLQGHKRVGGAGGCLVLDRDSKTTVAIYLSKYTCAFFFLAHLR